MATFTAIPEKTQTATAMKRVLDYVMQDKKTTLDNVKLVSGVNCVAEFAYDEFMATKHRYNKAKGVFFKQYVQSFKPNCGITPQQIHEIGLKTAQLFDGFELVVATHIDCDHWHNHFVVNSVNCETGHKIQIGEAELENLRHKSDEICQQYGLEILKPYEKPKQKSINQREYRAAIKGSSRKIKLINAIDYAVAHSRTKKEFIERMNKLGYGVKWIDRYKYITYTTPQGQSFRDNKLLDEKYLKTNMEELYDEYAKFETTESNRRTNRANSRNSDRTYTTDLCSVESGTVQPVSKAHKPDWSDHCKKYGFDIEATYTRSDDGISRRHSDRQEKQYSRYDTRPEQINPFHSGVGITQTIGEIEEYDTTGTEHFDTESESERFISMETETQVGRDWSDITIDALHLAADITTIGETDDNDKQKPKYVRERKRYRRKQQEDYDSNEIQMKM